MFCGPSPIPSSSTGHWALPWKPRAVTYNAMKNTMSTLSQADIINMNDGAERNDIYEGITTGKPTEVQLEHVKRQIRIIEECHKQNPFPKTIDIGDAI